MSAVKDVVRISNVNSANQVIIFIIVEKTILAGMQNIWPWGSVFAMLIKTKKKYTCVQRINPSAYK